MASLIHSMLNTELTSRPGSIVKIIGVNFSNTLCNGVTWLFLAWLIIYFYYETFMHVYLKKLDFMQYQRTRLILSLWLLAFFVSFIVYYGISLSDHKIIDFMNFKRIIISQSEHVPAHKILVQVVMCSFYLHMSFTQGVQLGSIHSLTKYLTLVAVFTTSYILRLTEITFTLMALLSVSGVIEEMAKMFYCLVNKDSKVVNGFVCTFYIVNVISFTIVYLVIIPLFFLIPLGIKVFSENTNPILIMLFGCFLCWLNLVVYKSLLLNLIFHWLYHQKKVTQENNENDELDDEKQKIRFDCLGNLIECSLFPRRRDDGYMIAFLRLETKTRQKRLIAKRKPKNRNMIIQTLKCMMAIKKKLSERRAENSDDSDESDEKTEEGTPIKNNDTKNINTDAERSENNTVKKSNHIFRFTEEKMEKAPQEDDLNRKQESEMELNNILEESSSRENIQVLSEDICVDIKDEVIVNRIENVDDDLKETNMTPLMENKEATQKDNFDVKNKNNVNKELNLLQNNNHDKLQNNTKKENNVDVKKN